jgi:hypothetical protein
MKEGREEGRRLMTEVFFLLALTVRTNSIRKEEGRKEGRTGGQDGRKDGREEGRRKIPVQTSSVRNISTARTSFRKKYQYSKKKFQCEISVQQEEVSVRNISTARMKFQYEISVQYERISTKYQYSKKKFQYEISVQQE